ncbi:MAG: FkbM family methyltransferase [Acidimicrobiales bacterium]
MPMTSYAQNHEDVLLARLFPRGLTGFYIDVGANDPIRHSVTKWFYDLGWRGINVEPAASPFARLAEARERDVNLNVGLSDQAGSMTFFELPPEVSAASTFSAAQAEWHRTNGFPAEERSVEVTTLAKVCEDYVDQPIDFLSVDVEGHERAVLEGGDWGRWRPRVVLVEATQPATTIPTHQEWEHVLLDANYEFAAFDGLNRYYVRAEDKDLLPGLATPVNVTDDYVPYEYLQPIQELRLTLDVHLRYLAAARALNSTLWAEYAGLPEELSVLRAQYERLERGLLHTRAQFEDVRTELSRQVEEMTPHVPDVGAIGLGIARRLTKLSRKFPDGSATAKRVIHLVRRPSP